MARGQQNSEQAEAYDEPEVVPLNPAATVPQSVGELLRKSREDFDIELRDAASYLCIRYPYLEAIEEGRLDELPGMTYAMGFVRAYADYLGLDSAAIVERYKDQTAELGGATRLVFPSPLTEGKVPSGAIILLAVVSLIVIYGGWVILGQQNVKIAELVPPLPESFSALLKSEETVKPAEDDSEAAAPETSESDSAEAGSQTETPEPAATLNVVENTPLEVRNSDAAGSVVAVAPRTDSADETTNETIAPDVAAASETDASSTPTDSAPQTITSIMVTPGAAPEPVQETPTPKVVVQETPAPEAATPQTEAATLAPVEITTPAETTAPAVAPAVSEVAEQPDASEDGPSTAAAQVATVESPAESSETAELPPTPPAVASAEPQRYGSDNIGARIVITAKVDSWVEIRDAGGDLLLTRVLRGGDSYRVPDNPGILMLTGNAGGLEILVDGVTVPKIGASGAVLHNVMLEPDALKAGTASRR